MSVHHLEKDGQLMNEMETSGRCEFCLPENTGRYTAALL